MSVGTSGTDSLGWRRNSEGVGGTRAAVAMLMLQSGAGVGAGTDG